MTILHDNELENTRLATVRRRKKKIPSWANSKFSVFFLSLQIKTSFYLCRRTTSISNYKSSLFSR